MSRNKNILKMTNICCSSKCVLSFGYKTPLPLEILSLLSTGSFQTQPQYINSFIKPQQNSFRSIQKSKIYLYTFMVLHKSKIPPMSTFPPLSIEHLLPVKPVLLCYKYGNVQMIIKQVKSTQSVTFLPHFLSQT